MGRHGITILLLIAALACYFMGMALPAAALLLVGGILEMAVWIRLFSKRPAPKQNSESPH